MSWNLGRKIFLFHFRFDSDFFLWGQRHFWNCWLNSYLFYYLLIRKCTYRWDKSKSLRLYYHARTNLLMFSLPLGFMISLWKSHSNNSSPICSWSILCFADYHLHPALIMNRKGKKFCLHCSYVWRNPLLQGNHLYLVIRRRKIIKKR